MNAQPHTTSFATAAILLIGPLGLIGLIAACGAPRDPDLEARAIAARAARSEPAPAPAESSPPPVKAPSVEAPPPAARRYSSAEIAGILARVPGDGPLLVTFETGLGPFTCQLFEREAPETVANFVGLALGVTPWQLTASSAPVARPLYDGLTFHRAIEAFIIQSGNPSGRTAGGPGWSIVRETGLSHLFDAGGALGMIDDGDHSHGSQFFVTLRADKSLARRYAAFGRCDALTIPRTIAAAEKRPHTGSGSAATPVNPVPLHKVRIHRSGTTAPAGDGE